MLGNFNLSLTWRTGSILQEDVCEVWQCSPIRVKVWLCECMYHVIG